MSVHPVIEPTQRIGRHYLLVLLSQPGLTEAQLRTAAMLGSRVFSVIATLALLPAAYKNLFVTPSRIVWLYAVLWIAGIVFFSDRSRASPRLKLGVLGTFFSLMAVGVVVQYDGFIQAGIGYFIPAVIIFNIIGGARLALLIALFFMALVSTLSLMIGIQSGAYIITAAMAIVICSIFPSVFVALIQLSLTESIERSNRAAEQALEAQQQAVSAQQAESRFLSNMSHEIRNPLNGVSGLIQLSLRESSLSSIHSHLRTALIAADHLKAIVNDILDFKKLEAGEFTLHPRSIDYTELRRSARTLYDQIAAEKHIHIDYPTQDSALPRFLVADPVRLSQLVANLVSNAVKFTPEHGDIQIRAAYDFEREMLNITVSDSGIGMSQQTISRLFERFHQGGNAPATAHMGTGLGLAIVKGILDTMGGSITVESEPGRGSTFNVFAPVAVDWERENAWREGRLTETPAPTLSAPDLCGITVLCVDDDPTCLSVLLPLLDKAGADVRVARSGQQALNIMQCFGSEIDIVLSDISMPEMDGEELLREIHTRSPDTPVVAVTGNVLEEDVRRYLDRGFAATLGKPFDVDQLIRIVAEHSIDPPRHGSGDATTP